MATRAFTLVRARRELAAVRIGRMAIRALRKRQRLFEISVRVALHAINLRVLSEQWEFRLGMIELLRRGNLLPSGSRVARFA